MSARIEKTRGRGFAALIFILGFAAAAWGQINVTAPAAKITVKAAPDYATEVLHDRWDMNQRTDLGWRIFNTAEQPVSLLSNISFSGGMFSATTLPREAPYQAESDANISILDSAYLGASDIGKFGVNAKIDASKYTVFAIRMYITPPINNWPTGQLFWSQHTMYEDYTTSNAFMIYGGWCIYLINLPALGYVNTPSTTPTPWSGFKESLRFDPTTQPGKNIQIDWIRLVQNGSEFRKTITWTGSGAVDIYLDNDQNSGNGNLGLLAKSASGGSYEFVTGGLAAGNYYVAIAPTGTSTYSYSTGYYAVTEQPDIRITKPSDEGSDQDFMTVAASNPWDFSSLSDVDYTVNVHDKSIRTIDYEDLAGQTFTGNTVFYGVSDATSGIGDPTVFFLSYAYRGKTYKIDTSRYHNLVAKMGIAGIHSTNDGSMARVMYMREDEHSIGENVSQDIIVRHTALPGGKWVMQKIVADLRTLPLEPGAGSPSHSGWTGTMDSFRLDPHEFSEARAFFFDDVRITADWRADASFPIEWTFEDGDTPTGATMSLYYDTDRSGYNGTLIQSGISIVPGNGSYTWNTSGIPGGTYYVYAVVTDANANQNSFYATGPLIVKHGGTPAIVLSKTSFNFGARLNGTPTPAETTELTNGGTGTLAWTATRSADWISVSPTSGTGNAVLSIGIARTNMGPGYYTGTVRIADADALNSPQTINVALNIYEEGSDNPPFGNYATPNDGVTVTSSLPVTGWVLDDIGIKSVNLYRGTGLGDRIFIGQAALVEGARPDVAVNYPGYPQNTRAGWGYMLLTNFLPNGGNGTFNIMVYATDTSDQEVLLGSRRVVCDNLHAVNPFGAIDTPAQGGTASGSAYVNFGWALTPQPKYIPTDGSTITVWVDGLPLGHPTYNNPRSDIATLFPGYANTNGAVGYYYLNTTALENKVHTISWSVGDSAGASDGIGSRYFATLNAAAPGAFGVGAADGSPDVDSMGTRSVRTDGRRPGTRTPAEIARIPEDRRTAVYVRRGMSGNGAAETAFPGTDGVVRIEIPEVSRVAVYLEEKDSRENGPEMEARGRRLIMGAKGEAENSPSSLGSANSRAARTSTKNATVEYEAYQLVSGELRPLPIGSSFDQKEGIFYWQPGPGFLGDYTIVFIRSDSGFAVRKTIIIGVRSRH